MADDVINGGGGSARRLMMRGKGIQNALKSNIWMNPKSYTADSGKVPEYVYDNFFTAGG
jgi:hypothetical protein